MTYLNYYRCSCGKRWVDTWSCTCNDRCPTCNTEIQPYRSDDFPEEDGDFQNNQVDESKGESNV
jgi:hypothetical protein